MFTRRSVLKGLASIGFGSVSLGAYALGIEPRFRLDVTRYAMTPTGWPAGLALKLAVVADIHAGEPYMPPGRIQEIVDRTNSLGADAILLLGDYAASHRWQTRNVPPREWAGVLAGLKAPLGVHAVLGNHDWWDDALAQKRGHGPVVGRLELERVGIPVYENDAVRLAKGGKSFWLAGLGDQIAIVTGHRGRKAIFKGMHDLPATLAKVTDGAPVILMAHEPDIFPKVPARVALTLSGHTHGGQVRIAGFSPVVPSSYGNRYAYGHVVEGGTKPRGLGRARLLETAGAFRRAAGDRAGRTRRARGEPEPRDLTAITHSRHVLADGVWSSTARVRRIRRNPACAPGSRNWPSCILRVLDNAAGAHPGQILIGVSRAVRWHLLQSRDDCSVRPH